VNVKIQRFNILPAPRMNLVNNISCNRTLQILNKHRQVSVQKKGVSALFAISRH